MVIRRAKPNGKGRSDRNLQIAKLKYPFLFGLYELKHCVAKPDHIAVLQGPAIHFTVVDVKAIMAVSVCNDDSTILFDEFCMGAGNSIILNINIGVTPATDSVFVFLKYKLPSNQYTRQHNDGGQSFRFIG